MTIEPGYPVTMTHPQHRSAKIVRDGDPSPGVPEQFPSVTVNGSSSEAEYRAKGYLRYGEAQPASIDHHEYPKMMRHPNYEPEVPAQTEAKIDNGRIVGTFTIPAKPAKFPDIFVSNLDQEKKAIDSGYAPAGTYNRAALEAVLSDTVDEETYEPEQYPKWVNGTLVERDPNEAEPYRPDSSYPRFENGILVQDPRKPAEPDPNLYPMWVHKNGKPSDESVLVKNEREEFEIRAKWTEKTEAEAEIEAEEEEIIEVAPKHKHQKSMSAAAKILAA